MAPGSLGSEQPGVAAQLGDGLESKDRLLLRVPEAAEALGISRSQMYQLVAAGVVPVIRIGRSVRVPIEALRQWVGENTAEALTSREAT